MAKGGRKEKRPLSPLAAAPEKQPHTSEGIDFRTLRPVWRVGRLEMVDPYGWHVLDAAGVARVRERLKNFEAMTWMEILVAGRKQNHKIKVEDLCADAQARLQELELDQIPELISLRVTARERIFGILQENVLDLLWWDPEHAVCPSKGADN